jgi:hypothetical protein
LYQDSAILAVGACRNWTRPIGCFLILDRIRYVARWRGVRSLKNVTFFKLRCFQAEAALEIAKTQRYLRRVCIHLFKSFDKQADEGPQILAGFFFKQQARG